MKLRQRTFRGFAVIVDINSFTTMVAHPESSLIADFVRDVLIGAVRSIEECGGEVVGLMGDAILGLVEEAPATYRAVVGLARDLNEQCRYISSSQRGQPHVWPFSPGGPSLKVGIEYGHLEVADFKSSALGSRSLFIGNAINYAARITKPGKGNRCHVGPTAYGAGLSDFSMKGPYKTAGKEGEGTYRYYQLDLSAFWKEGLIHKGARSYILR